MGGRWSGGYFLFRPGAILQDGERSRGGGKTFVLLMAHLPLLPLLPVLKGDQLGTKRVRGPFAPPSPFPFCDDHNRAPMQTPLFSLPSDRAEQTWRKIPPSSRPLPFHVHTLQPSYSCSLLIWPFSSTITPSLSLLRVRKCVVVWDSPRYSKKTLRVRSPEPRKKRGTRKRLPD